MKRYRYSGPVSSITLPDGSEKPLIPGRCVDLPDQPPPLNLPRLLALRYLQPCCGDCKKQSVAPAVAEAAIPQRTADDTAQKTITETHAALRPTKRGKK